MRKNSRSKQTAPAKRKTRRAHAVKANSTVEFDSIVVYMHGIGKHLPADQLKLEWDLALFGKDLGNRSRMAYWSDLLHPPATSTRSKRRVAEDSTDELDVDALLADAGVAKSAAARDYALAVLSDFGVDTAAMSHRGPGKQVLPLPGFLRKPISRAFIKTFIKDTAAYFFQDGMRKKIRQRLVDQLQLPPDQKVTIVAHSQGSVVAYEVLSTLAAGSLGLQALVTIGSPLGIREVQDFLDPDKRRIPTLVERWANFSDPLDPVALDKGLANDFNDRPRNTIEIQDEMIVNSATRRLFGFNPHSAVGYLAHPSVRRIVADTMHIDVVGRFVLARDVAERLALVDTERQPVLIEALEPEYPAVDERLSEMQKREEAEREGLVKSRRDRSPLTLAHRITSLAERLSKEIVTDREAAEIDPLRRFVAARLTASELRMIGQQHKDLRVYAVWRSTRKSKHTWRSMQPIKADAALSSFGASGHDITWAVLDTGIQGNHPHFNGVIKAVWDCTKTGAPVEIPVTQARDRDGHGTHVSGIITGRCNNGKGAERGVAPATRLVVYKVLKDNGEGEDAWIIKALDHIAAQNEQMADGLAIHGVNLSLGGPFDNTVYGCGFSPLCAELRRLWRSGVLVVVSSGNEGTMQVNTPDGEVEINCVMSIGDPANLDECIAVGSVHADKPHLYGISSFSSRGPTADGRGKPDVVAPGERISSCNAAFQPGNVDSMYRDESGTSMAAPHVSGLLAAFLSVRREFRGRPDEVKRVLLNTCTDLGRDRYQQGHGMPNLMQMLLSV